MEEGFTILGVLVAFLLAAAAEAFVYWQCAQAGFGFWGFFAVAVIGSIIAAVVRGALKGD